MGRGCMRQSGVMNREGSGWNPPFLGDPELCGPAFSGLQQQLQVISGKLDQVSERPGLNLGRPALQHILEVQGLNDFGQGDLVQSKVAVTPALGTESGGGGRVWAWAGLRFK